MKKHEKTLRVGNYVRRSEDEKNRQEYSLAAQKEICKNYAESQGYEIVKVIEESHSAKKEGSRPLFMQMLKDLEDDKFDGVLVHKVNRLLRSLGDFVRVEKLMQKGKKFIFVDGQFPDTPEGRLMFVMQAGLAKWYIENLSVEVKKGNRQALLMGRLPRKAPIGYLDAEPGKRTGKGIKHLDRIKAPKIRDIFLKYDTGLESFKSLSGWLFSEGVMTPSGKPLNPQAIQVILSNPFYYGVIRYNGEEFPGIHDPIISKDLFDSVQSIMKGRNPFDRGNKPLLFAYKKLLTCSCQRKLSPYNKKGHVYYGCMNPHCPEKTIREEAVEEQIAAVFEKALVNLRQYMTVKNSMRELQKQTFGTKMEMLASITEKKARLEDQLAKCRKAVADGAFSSEDFEQEKKRIEAEMKQFEVERMDYEMLDPEFMEEQFLRLELFKTALESYKTLDVTMKHQLVSLSFLELHFKNKVLAYYKLKESMEIFSRPLGVNSGAPDLMDLNRFLTHNAKDLYTFIDSLQSSLASSNALALTQR